MSLSLLAASTLVSLTAASYSPFFPEPNAIFLETDQVWYDNITNIIGWSHDRVSDEYYHGFWSVKHLRHGPHLTRSFYVPHTSDEHRLLLSINFTFTVGCGFNTDISTLWYDIEYSGERIIYKKIDSIEINPDITGVYDIYTRENNYYTEQYCHDNDTSSSSSDSIDSDEDQDDNDDFTQWNDISLSRSFLLSNSNDDDSSNGQNNVLTIFFGGSVNEEENDNEFNGVWGLHSVSIEVEYEDGKGWAKGEYHQQSSAVNSNNNNNYNSLFDKASTHVTNGVNSVLDLPWWAISLICVGLLLVLILLIVMIYKCVKFIYNWSQKPLYHKRSWSRQSSDLGENLELINRQSSLFVSNVFNDEIMKKPVWDHDSDGSDDVNSHESSPKKKNKKKKSKKQNKSNSASSSLSTRFDFRLFDVTKRPQLPPTNEVFNEESVTSSTHYVQESTAADMDDLLLSVDSLLSRSKQSSTPRWTMMSPQANMNLNMLDLNKITSSIMSPFTAITKKAEMQPLMHSNTHTISPSNTRVITGQVSQNGGPISPSGRSYAMVRNDRSGSIIESNFDIPENASELSDTDYQALLFQDMAEQQNGLQVIGTAPVLSPKKAIIDYSKFNIADNALDHSKQKSPLNTISESKNEAASYESYGTSTTSDQGETDPNDVMREIVGGNSDNSPAAAANSIDNKQGRKEVLKTIELMNEGQITTGGDDNDNDKDEIDSDGSLSVNDQDAIDSTGNESEETEIEDDSGSSVLNVTDATNLNNGATDEELEEYRNQREIEMKEINKKAKNGGKGKRKSKSKLSFMLRATPEDDGNNNGGNYVTLDDVDTIPEPKSKGRDKDSSRGKISFPSFNAYLHMKSRKDRNQSIGAFSDL